MLITTQRVSAVCEHTWSSLDWGSTTADFTAGAETPACVLVSSNTCVEIDEPSIYLDSIRIEGELRFSDGLAGTFNAHKIIVEGDANSEAVLWAGDESTPYLSDLNIELGDGAACSNAYIITSGSNTLNVVSLGASPNPYHPLDNEGNLFENHSLIALGNARLELHGAPRDTTWTTLNLPALTGDTTLNVLNANTWVAEDEIVLAPTDFDTNAYERHILNSVNSAPLLQDILTLSTTVDHLHWSGITTQSGAPTIFERGEVGLLSHNIKVYTPDAELVDRTPELQSWYNDFDSDQAPAECTSTEVRAHDGAEIILEQAAGNSPTLYAKYIEVFNAGKFGQLAHYPIHFHHLGATDSHVIGVSVHDSANRGIVLHGTQGVRLENNVATNINGHTYYLEKSDQHDTAFNTLKRNLAVATRNCNPLERLPSNSPFDGAASFYWEDPRNNFILNSAAGSGYAGFYSDHKPGALDAYHLCANNEVDYDVTDYNLLNIAAIDFSLIPWDETEYDAKGFAIDDDEDGVFDEVACHGAFVNNVAHGVVVGFWSEQHKNTMIRLNSFTVTKAQHRGVLIKNKGITEIYRLRAAGNKTAVWPASHAYHMQYTPRWLVYDSHIVGESLNDANLPATPVLGVEVYEGHLHITKTHFSGYPTWRNQWAAFGTHQAFPFYSNNPNNSVSALSFGINTRPVWFDIPDAWAAGEKSVMLRDQDGSITGSPTPSWIVSTDPFIIPAAASGWSNCSVAAPPCEMAAFQDWQAYVVPKTEERYAQLLLRWCDRSVHWKGNLNTTADDDETDSKACSSNNGPSGGWTQPPSGGNGYYGIVERGINLEDISEGDVLMGKHSNEGTHDTLGANILSGHDYEFSLWSDTTTELTSDDLFDNIEAMAVHLRYMPGNTSLTATIPVPGEPCEIHLYSGENQVQIDDSLNPMVEIVSANPINNPVVPTEWRYADNGTDRTVTVYLDSSMDRTDVSVSMLFEDSIGRCGAI